MWNGIFSQKEKIFVNLNWLYFHRWNFFFNMKLCVINSSVTSWNSKSVDFTNFCHTFMEAENYRQIEFGFEIKMEASVWKLGELNSSVTSVVKTLISRNFVTVLWKLKIIFKLNLVRFTKKLKFCISKCTKLIWRKKWKSYQWFVWQKFAPLDLK